MSEDYGIKTVSEVANHLNCSGIHLRDVLRREGIRCIRVGKSEWIFSLLALSEVLEQVEEGEPVLVNVLKEVVGE